MLRAITINKEFRIVPIGHRAEVDGYVESTLSRECRLCNRICKSLFPIRASTHLELTTAATPKPPDTSQNNPHPAFSSPPDKAVYATAPQSPPPARYTRHHEAQCK